MLAEQPYDILVNNAGTNKPAPFVDVKVEDFDFVMSLNVRAAYFVVQAVARRLIEAKRGGSIINMSSSSATKKVAPASRPPRCMSLLRCCKAGQRVATIDLDSRQKSFTHYIENRRDWAARARIKLELPTHFCVARGRGAARRRHRSGGIQRLRRGDERGRAAPTISWSSIRRATIPT